MFAAKKPLVWYTTYLPYTDLDDATGNEVPGPRMQHSCLKWVWIHSHKINAGELRGVEWAHGLFLFPLVLGKM